MLLTQNLLKSLFYYNKGRLIWKVNMGPNKVKGLIAGYNNIREEGNRWMIKIKGTLYLRSRLIFLYHKGYLPVNVDHRDRDTSNDRISNLRAATTQQNNSNITPRKGSSSKFLGVSFNSKKKKFRASINIKGKCKNLGCFEIETDAAKAYNEAALIHHKEFANLNIIKT